MDLDPGFLLALLQIIGLNLGLAGDNAVVIALAARNLPRQLRRRALIFGALAAVLLRIALTAGVVALLQVPLLKLVGGLALLRIAWKLALEEPPAEGDVDSADSLRAAIMTILVADVVMSVDNVLAVAAAADGSYLLIVLGLVISIPIVVGGATILLQIVHRFPVTVWMGAALIAFTGAELALADESVHRWLGSGAAWVDWSVSSVVTALVIGGAWLQHRRRRPEPPLKVEGSTADD